ncbi:putative polysaccharide biosynthesis protein [Cellulosilyticum sp. I15G10I2]|uniref:putative polysaccharide biosynthesis protein n=1 Tax=Cellulosilyticum sp. I15G10I2 TaxID=1892843 RepID=UPI0009F50453|nr:polysaccharide biosynthesis protein [Cellulosilyticum sp. I15G10I2]
MAKRVTKGASYNATQTFVKGALILSMAGLIAKVLSAFFRVPLGNLIGDTGMGYYQAGYPIYTLFTAIAIVGIPSTIAKLVAEKRVLGEYQAAKDIFTHTMKLMLGIGIIVSLLIFLATPFMIDAFNWVPETKYSLWGLALSPFFVCIMGVFRGYFQGMQNMAPTAVSQVLENLGRVVIGLLLAFFFFPNLGKAAGGASFGAVAGGMCGAAVLALFYLRNKTSINDEIQRSETPKKQGIGFKTAAKMVLIIAIPISIGAAVNSIINFIDSALVIKMLTQTGVELELANAYFGQLGKVATFINFPLTFGMALVIGLVPAISEAAAKKDRTEVQTKIELGMRFAILLAMPASIGLAVLADPIMKFIYANAPDGGNILAAAALSILFIMLGQAFTGILQGIGKVWQPVIGIGLAAFVKTILNIILVTSSFKVIGAAIASIAAYMVFALYNYIMMKKYTGFKLNTRLVIIRPLISSSAMGVLAWGTYRVLGSVIDTNSFTSNALVTILSIGVGGLAYLVLIFVTGAITKKDIQEILNKKEK